MKAKTEASQDLVLGRLKLYDEQKHGHLFQGQENKVQLGNWR